MRVALDLSPRVRPGARGVTRAVSGVLEALEALEREGRVELLRLEPPPGAPQRRWRQSALAPAAREGGARVLHSFVSAFPLRGHGLARVQTVHELPWRHGVKENADLRHRLWARLGPLLCERVVCPTAHVARDLGRGRGRVRVVPWGVGPPFAEDPPPGVVDEPVLDHYRLGEEPYALCLGATRPKKNLAAAIHGLAERLRRGEPGLHLVVTGAEESGLRRDLGLASKLGLARWMKTLGEVPDEDLAPLLRLASFACVLSRSEGFGLPVLEALACGTPVLVPTASAQAEVAGEHGIAVDPDDPGSVADAMERALAERETLRLTVPARAAELTWERSARELLCVWEELA